MMQRILIVGPAWVGDMVMAGGAVRRLAELHPGATIDMLATPATAPIAERMPGIGRVWVLPASHGKVDLRVRARLAREIRPIGYELALILPGSWKSALVPMLARIPRRRGYVREWRFGLLNEPRKLDEAKLARTVDRFAALAEESDVGGSDAPSPELRADPARAKALAETLGLPLDRPVLVLCPGAEYGPAKRWPERHFADLALAAGGRGYRVWVIGSPKDSEAGTTIAALAGEQRMGVANLCGRTSLLDAVDLLSLASAVVSNDSGLMHVAGALGRPVVGIYGSSSATMTPPLGARSAIAEIELPCRPCFQRTCPLGHTNCLNQLMPALVEGKVFGLVEKDDRLSETTSTEGQQDEAPVAESPFGATIVIHRKTDRGLELLVLRRSGRRLGDSGDWAWTPPSGSRLPDEDVADCAVRELREETGLVLTIRQTEHGTPDWAVFEGEARPDDRISLSVEHDEYEWVSGDEAVRRCAPEIVASQIRRVVLEL